jgi:hypothetical protein
MPSGWTPVAPDQQDPREGTSRVLPIGEERSFTSASSSTAPQCAEAEAAAILVLRQNLGRPARDHPRSMRQGREADPGQDDRMV